MHVVRLHWLYKSALYWLGSTMSFSFKNVMLFSVFIFVVIIHDPMFIHFLNFLYILYGYHLNKLPKICFSFLDNRIVSKENQMNRSAFSHYYTTEINCRATYSCLHVHIALWPFWCCCIKGPNIYSDINGKKIILFFRGKGLVHRCLFWYIKT